MLLLTVHSNSLTRLYVLSTSDSRQTWTFHVHEVRIWTLDKSFLFMLPSLNVNRRMEEVFGQL